MNDSGSDPDPDPGSGSGSGLQRERTVLSWRRTALALTAVGTVQLRGVADLRDPMSIPGILLVVVGLVYMAWGWLDYHRGTLVTAQQDRRPLYVVGIAVALFSALTAVAVVTEHLQ